jgi:glutathione-independent formaldehyde dehydrogenase
VISLDDASKGYQDFDKGAAKKFVIDPHGVVRKQAAWRRILFRDGRRICAS